VLLENEQVTTRIAVPGPTSSGLERLTGFIIPAMVAGELASEELRLLIQAFRDHQESELVMTRRPYCWNAGRRGARRWPIGGSAMRQRRDGRVRR
jgi:hypothetical protein